MNNRLSEIIEYKTGGKKQQFAELLGWSPQYLTKLLNGVNFGIQPVMTLLSAFPEISARWLLFGEGSMLEVGRMFELQRKAMENVQRLLSLDKYIPYMEANEIAEFEQAITKGHTPEFSEDDLLRWQERRTAHNREIVNRFTQAMEGSDELCNQKTVKR